MKTLNKILIIRFSSIGDIVLTTPIIRCAKQQLSGAEIHFVTKEIFKETLVHNPYINKLITFKNDVSEVYEVLKAENYDVLIDLHKNLRSLRLKQFLKIKSYSFNKLNFKKFLAVNFKLKNSLPNKHIVDRYFETIANIGVMPDEKGLDYFLNEQEKVNCNDLFFKSQPTKFIALVIGGSYFTKQIPINKLKEICKNSKLPIILMGGKSDKDIANELQNFFHNSQNDYPSHREGAGRGNENSDYEKSLINACGNFSLNQSASIISQAEWIITSDTGLMHIAAAFNKKIISVWGNTIPEFGMSPYLPNTENKILEIKNLSCRPCSKLGYKKCPKGHFKCMNEIDFEIISFL